MKRKKIINIIIISIIGMFLFCLFFSKTINNMLLPKVSAVQLKSQSLGDIFHTEGTISYENTHAINAKEDWKVNEVSVRVNQQVQVGDIIGKVNNDAIELKEREVNVNIMKLKGELKKAKETPNEEKEKISELEYEISTEELKLKQIRKGLDKDGNIISDVAGTVVSIKSANGSGEGANSLVEIADDKSKLVVTFNVGEKEVEKFSEGTAINVTEGTGDEKKLQATVIEKKYDTEKEQFTLKAEINDEANVKFGERVKVNSTEENKRYDNVIPKSCIADDGGQTYIYVLSIGNDELSDVYVVKKVDVKITASDSNNCSICPSSGSEFPDNYGIVMKTTKPIEDKTEVKLESES